MNIRHATLAFCVFLLSILCYGYYGNVTGVSVKDSLGFQILVWASFGIVFAMTLFSKTTIKVPPIRRNIGAAIVAILAALGFAFCTSAYYINEQHIKYDFSWEPVAMSILSGLSVISMIILAISLFTGKNYFKNLSFFLFCPVLQMVLSMLLILTISSEKADVFEVCSRGFLMLFFLYFTQIFSNSSNSNITKLVYLFGLPAILFIAVTFSTGPQIFTGTFMDYFRFTTKASMFLNEVFLFFILFFLIRNTRELSTDTKIQKVISN